MIRLGSSIIQNFRADRCVLSVTASFNKVLGEQINTNYFFSVLLNCSSLKKVVALFLVARKSFQQTYLLLYIILLQVKFDYEDFLFLL